MPEWKGRVPLTRSHCERITKSLSASSWCMPVTIQNNARKCATVTLFTKVSQRRKIGTRGRRRKGRGLLNLRIRSFAGNSKRQSFAALDVKHKKYNKFEKQYDELVSASHHVFFDAKTPQRHRGGSIDEDSVTPAPERIK
ncbi:hypothetical protein EVAR_64125_1 [Eumeta japonica]|uniref:Uncharacterized protein n=1 Tax=Eumeta variegata TaxID=151549 RepID=A0A4C1Z849_EUMVA|nr:hypothetical protein EVAR_64125_1 [Eumeta japonica]